VKSVDSLILRDIPSELIADCEHSSSRVYRGSRDGFAASNFHDKCDGRSSTVNIIESTAGYVFGGFTPVAWEKSFLFTVTNLRGCEFRKFGPKYDSDAIACGPKDGRVFGRPNDIQVHDNCNTNRNNCTWPRGAFMNETGVDGREVFTGESNFTGKKLDVFSIGLERFLYAIHWSS
jgi:hypothetical protein